MVVVFTTLQCKKVHIPGGNQPKMKGPKGTLLDSSHIEESEIKVNVHGEATTPAEPTLSFH